MAAPKRPDQEDYFFKVEADAWFRRTLPYQRGGRGPGAGKRHFLESEVGLIELMRRAELRPKVAVEIGGSGGGFSDAVRKAFGCRITLIEPSAEAVAYARKRHPAVRAEHGVASRLPFEDNSVDTVILKGVFCWIGRESLLRAVAEIDRILADGGHLVVKDYLPDGPRKTRSHHVRGADVFCFKTDYARVFLDTGLYVAVLNEIYVDGADAFPGADLFDSRNQVSILRKSYLGYYRSHDPHLKGADGLR